MSEMNVADAKFNMAKAAEAVQQIVDKTKQLPDPVGYKLLCGIPEVEHKYENGILKADSTVKIEEHSTTVLFVLKLGAQAFKDKDKFPYGAWCKEGDFVIARAYSGTRFKIHGREFRLLNDDQVEATVDDPRGISRA